MAICGQVLKILWGIVDTQCRVFCFQLQWLCVQSSSGSQIRYFVFNLYGFCIERSSSHQTSKTRYLVCNICVAISLLDHSTSNGYLSLFHMKITAKCVVKKELGVMFEKEQICIAIELILLASPILPNNE